MARMKFLCDAERCIECNGCVTACKQENDVPWGVNRRRVVTINDGVPGERSISVGALLFMLGALGHIYIGTIGMTGAYEGMRHGYVDEEWAKEHHRLWYDEVKAGRAAASETGRPAATRHRAA